MPKMKATNLEQIFPKHSHFHYQRTLQTGWTLFQPLKTKMKSGTILEEKIRMLQLFARMNHRASLVIVVVKLISR